ncbi:hypothetical protein RHMOL_Rhmol06G0196600 [Rhododendron molle]|nr:hypothetical protein RHMOL_Rhmol06G0196600 [Rhododendron molle]
MSSKSSNRGETGGLTYKEAGVDIDAGSELVRRIAKMAPGIGGFGGLFPLGEKSSFQRDRFQSHLWMVLLAGSWEASGDRIGISPKILMGSTAEGDSYLVAGTDGVGTKLKLVFETGIHETIGIDLVAMSVNDIVTSGAKPLFFLDYFATSHLDVDLAEKPLQRMKDELNSYAWRHSLAELGENEKELFEGYNMLENFEQLQVSETCSQVHKEMNLGRIINWAC